MEEKTQNDNSSEGGYIYSDPNNPQIIDCLDHSSMSPSIFPEENLPVLLDPAKTELIFKMDLLLQALKAEDQKSVEDFACDLFITNVGRCNWENIKEFEKLASCEIVPLEQDSFGWLIGGIRYNGKTYPYG